MRFVSFFYTSVMLALICTKPSAQISADSLKLLKSACEINIEIQSTLNSDQVIRAENINYCEANNGETVLWFDAAAITESRFIESANAPWMHIELLDASGKVLNRVQNAFLVEIANCGGHEFHLRRIPNDYRGEVDDVRISIEEADVVPCTRNNFFKDVVEASARIITSAKECNDTDAGLVKNQIAPCEFIKETAKDSAALAAAAEI